MVKRITHPIRCSVNTMSQGCFEQINNYINKFDIKGNTVEETKSNIQELPQFKSGCFTYLQALAFAEYIHGIVRKKLTTR